MKRLAYGACGVGVLFTPLVFGQTATPPLPSATAAVQGDTTNNLGSVIVTGTRQQGLKAVDSAAPIQVIDNTTLQRTGQSDVMQALAAVIPSFTADAFGGDTANLTLSARLRGLSPNNALVLINGKRRHTSANLHVLGGSPSSGAAAADLSLIPLSAIDHVEVLLDGAAAQYGTDAIAGVINIILKKSSSGGNIDLTGGEYFDEGGRTGAAALNIGLKPIDNSFLNLSAEQKYHGFSNRGAIDGRLSNPAVLNDPVNRQVVNFPDYPNSNRIHGDALYRSRLLSFNSGYELSDALQFYSFGTYGQKKAEAYENYRLPSRIPKIYPQGFNPKETLDEVDFGLTAGAKGVVSNWNWDFSVTHGADIESIGTINSGNASLNGQYVPAGSVDGYTQTSFHDGNFRTGQTTVNLDVSREFEVGLTAPVTLAGGLEYRSDRYAIEAGDPQSYYLSGAQSFVGYSPVNAGSYSRNDKSAYVDVAVTPVKNLLVDLAGRFEDYSDFGQARVGKATARYELSQAFAVRGTYSNGFRAPTLAEQFYSGNNVGPTSIYLQLPPNSAAAKAFNLANLKPEKSNNISFGFVAHPSEAATLTIDAYQITLKDRILASGDFDGYRNGVVRNQSILNALTAAGVDPVIYRRPDGSAGVSFFTNGADTRTRGLDLVFNYASNYGKYGNVDWSVGGNYTTTKLTKVGTAPAALGGAQILERTASSVLTDATPKFRLTGAALWRYGPWTVSLRETIYGKSSYDVQDYDGNYVTTKISTKALTDLEISDQVTKGWLLAVGAKNLFNTYPNKINSAVLSSYTANYSNGNVGQYPTNSPFGINGGYYYVRANYKF